MSRLIIKHLFVLVLFSCTSKPSKKNEIIINLKLDITDYKSIFNKLYDIPIIDSVGTAIWEPNFQEQQQFNISYDNKCHTLIDTLLIYKDSEGKERAIFIFKTITIGIDSLKKIEHIVGCHFCTASVGIAILSKTETKSWNVLHFKKYFCDAGLFGGVGKEGIGKFSIKKIANSTFLDFKEPVSGNGNEVKGIERLFVIDDKFECSMLENIFSQIYYEELGSNIISREINTENSNNFYILVNKIFNNKEISKDTFFFSSKYCKYLGKNDLHETF